MESYGHNYLFYDPVYGQPCLISEGRSGDEFYYPQPEFLVVEQAFQTDPPKSYEPYQNEFNQTSHKVSSLTIGTYCLLPHQPLNKHFEKTSDAIGYDEREGKVISNTTNRLVNTIKNLEDTQLDIICIQRVSNLAFDTIMNRLNQKEYDGIFASDNPTASPQLTTDPEFLGVAIFYKYKQFQLLAEYPDMFTYNKKGNPEQLHRADLTLDLFDPLNQNTLRITSCDLVNPLTLEDKTAHTAKLLHYNSDAEISQLSYSLDYLVFAGQMSQDQFGDKDIDRSGDLVYPNIFRATSLHPFSEEGYHFDESYQSSNFARSDPLDFSSTIVTTGEKTDYIFVKSYNPLLTEIKTHEINNLDRRSSNHPLIATEIVSIPLVLCHD